MQRSFYRRSFLLSLAVVLMLFGYSNCGPLRVSNSGQVDLLSEASSGQSISPLVTVSDDNNSGIGSGGVVLGVGGESSGGGSSVISPVTGKRVMLDYFATMPTQHAEFTQVPGVMLNYKTTSNSFLLGGPIGTLADQGAVADLVIERLDRWKGKSGIPAEISNVLTIDLVINHKLANGGRWFIPDELTHLVPQLEIKTVMFYDVWKSTMQVIEVNPEVYNQLDLYSQAGVFIHEALRFAQLSSHSLILGPSFSDEQLQQLTTKIMFTNP